MLVKWDVKYDAKCAIRESRDTINGARLTNCNKKKRSLEATLDRIIEHLTDAAVIFRNRYSRLIRNYHYPSSF